MERKKRIYRHLKTLAEAGRILKERFGSLIVDTETICVRESLGRVLSGHFSAGPIQPSGGRPITPPPWTASP